MKKLSKAAVTKIAEAKAALDEAISEAQDYADGKSDTWRDGDAGTNYAAWIEELEQTADALDNLPLQPEPYEHRHGREYLIALIEGVAQVPYAYSGRGMYGRTCVGFDTDDDPLAVLADVIAGADDAPNAADILRGARTDGMGRGTVIYWPDVAWPDGCEDEE